MNDYMVETAWITKTGRRARQASVDPRRRHAHDAYRSGGFHGLKAGLDANGKIVAWHQHFITFGEGKKSAPAAISAPTNSPQAACQTSAWHTSPCLCCCAPAASRPRRAMHTLRLPVVPRRTGRSRRPRPSRTSSSISSPPHRRPIPAKSPVGDPDFNPERMKGVLQLVAEKSGWANRKKTPGRGMGVAFYFCHLGYFAEVADVTVDKPTKSKSTKSGWPAMLAATSSTPPRQKTCARR